jgi:hypothetical protein
MQHLCLGLPRASQSCSERQSVHIICSPNTRPHQAPWRRRAACGAWSTPQPTTNIPQRARPAQGTVLIHSGAELETYSRSEEDRLEALIAGIAASGAKATSPHPRLLLPPPGQQRHAPAWVLIMPWRGLCCILRR